MLKRRTAGVAIAVVGVLTGVGLGDAAAAEPVVAEPSAACTYQASKHPGLPGGDHGGYINATDGGEYLAAIAYPDLSPNTYPRGVVWRNGSLVLEFGPLGSVVDINRSGYIVGYASNNPSLTLVTPGGQWRELATPPMQNRWGTNIRGITEDGQVIGTLRVSQTTVHGVSWSVDSPQVVRDLGTAAHFTDVRDVGDNGEIVGAVQSGTRLRAYVGTVNGVTLLGGVDPNADSAATQIAGSYILGTGTIPGQAPGNILWHNGVPTRLPGSGTVTGVNPNGDVVGYETVSGRTQPFVIRGGVRTALPLLDGAIDAYAQIITEDGRVGGWSWGGIDTRRTLAIWTCA